MGKGGVIKKVTNNSKKVTSTAKERGGVEKDLSQAFFHGSIEDGRSNR